MMEEKKLNEMELMEELKRFKPKKKMISKKELMEADRWVMSKDCDKCDGESTLLQSRGLNINKSNHEWREKCEKCGYEKKSRINWRTGIRKIIWEKGVGEDGSS